MLEQAQTDLQAQDAADSIIDAGHRDLALLGQVHDHVHAFRIVRVHDHVDAGIDAQRDSLPLVSRHVVARIEIVDVGPVRHQQAVPVQLLLHPAGEQQRIGMRRDAVDGGGIHHGSESAGLEAFLERAEEFFAQVILGDIGRGAVLSGERHAIAHEVLEAHGTVLQADVIGVAALDGDRLDAGHLGLQVRIFAETLPDTGPARIAAQVHDGREHPRALCGPGLIGHGPAHREGIVAVEGGTEVDLLGIERTLDQIRGAVDHVQAIDARDTQHFHRLVLDLPDHGGGLLAGMGGVVHHVEDGTHFVFADDLVQFDRIDGFVRVVLNGHDGQLDQLAGLLFQGHAFQDLFDLRLHVLVGRNGRFDGRLGRTGGDQDEQGCK